MNLATILKTTYSSSFTLFDAINDKRISEYLDRAYVPRLEIIGNNIFIKKDESITVTDNDPLSIKFIYLNPKGINRVRRDDTFVQIPLNRNGFLIRLSIPTNKNIPENLSMDYFIDISNIKYHLDTIYIKDNNTMLKKDMIRFKNISLSDYSHITFDPMFIEFQKHQKDLFEIYF